MLYAPHVGGRQRSFAEQHAIERQAELKPVLHHRVTVNTLSGLHNIGVAQRLVKCHIDLPLILVTCSARARSSCSSTSAHAFLRMCRAVVAKWMCVLDMRRSSPLSWAGMASAKVRRFGWGAKSEHPAKTVQAEHKI